MYVEADVVRVAAKARFVRLADLGVGRSERPLSGHRATLVNDRNGGAKRSFLRELPNGNAGP